MLNHPATKYLHNGPQCLLVCGLLALHAGLRAPRGAVDLAGSEAEQLSVSRREVAERRTPGHHEHRRAVSVLRRATVAGGAVRKESGGHAQGL